MLATCRRAAGNAEAGPRSRRGPSLGRRDCRFAPGFGSGPCALRPVYFASIPRTRDSEPGAGCSGFRPRFHPIRSTSWAVRSFAWRPPRCGNRPSGWCDWRATVVRARAARSIGRPRRIFSPRRVDRLRRRWGRPAMVRSPAGRLGAGSATRRGAGSGLGITAGSDRAAGSLSARGRSRWARRSGPRTLGAAGRGRFSGGLCRLVHDSQRESVVLGGGLTRGLVGPTGLVGG